MCILYEYDIIPFKIDFAGDDPIVSGQRAAGSEERAAGSSSSNIDTKTNVDT